jgi:hypothetical protein
MKKITAGLMIIISAIAFSATGSKNGNRNLNNNVKVSEKSSKNTETVQQVWNRVKPEIKARMDKLAKATINGDYMANINELPEKYLSYMAKKASMTVPEFKNSTVKLLSGITKDVKFTKSTHDLENAKIGKTSRGRSYALIPTTVTMSVKGKSIESKGKILAFEDENRWYLVNFDKNYITSMKELYPDLMEIK